MKLKKLQLENFRNYDTYTFDFPENKDLIVLVGENGKGKTNFLEAIYMLSLGRSFRTLNRDSLVNWQSDYMRCRSQVELDGEDATLEASYSRLPIQKRVFKKNDVNLKISDFIGNLLTVLFHPEDLNMLYLSPSYRRQYLDILLSQSNKKYLYSLSQYKKVLKQRNALLQAIREKRFKRLETQVLEEDLDAWDQQIVQFGSYVLQERHGLVEFLAQHLQNVYRSISDGTETLSVKYITKTENYLDELKFRRERELREGRTTVGPHLDDLEFCLENQSISESASRGEFRTLLLAIKLAEIQYLKTKTGRNPVLLLDDVFSELDKERQKHLLKVIKGCQTIITTTNAYSFKELEGENQTILFVNL